MQLDFTETNQIVYCISDLRLAVRSSLWTKDTSSHEHDFGSETYNEEEDMYSKTCTSCGHTVTYEKM